MMPVAEGSTTQRKVLIAALVIEVMALILQIVGFATPGWMIMYYESFNEDSSSEARLTLGLWYDQVKICLNNICQTMSIGAFLKNLGFPDLSTSADMTEYRVETIIGLITILAAIIFVQFLVCRPISVFKRVVLGFACLASALNCIMALTASGRFRSKTISVHNKVGLFSPFLVPYSIIITGVGGILAAILLVILVIEPCNINNREVPNQQGQTVAMATYSQDARHYAVPSQISGYPQHAGATSPYAEQNSKWQGNLVVGNSFPSGNHLVTKFHYYP